MGSFDLILVHRHNITLKTITELADLKSGFRWFETKYTAFNILTSQDWSIYRLFPIHLMAI